MAPKSLQKDSRIKEAQFIKTVQAGTWQSFLEQDAVATQKSIRAWWYNHYSHTEAARSLSKQAKTEIQELLDMTPLIDVDRDALHPDTVSIIEAWQSLPLADGSEECKKAMHRLLANLVGSGQLKHALSSGLRVHVDLHMLSEARCWLYRDVDGTIQRFTPLQQPWRYKALHWDDERRSLFSGLSSSTCAEPPNPPVNQTRPCESEHLRLSLMTFWTLIDGVNSTEPSGLTALHAQLEGTETGQEDDDGALREYRSGSATPGPAHQEGAPLSFPGAGKWKAVNDSSETEHEANIEPNWVMDSKPQDISVPQPFIRYSVATEVPLGWPSSSSTTDNAKSNLPKQARAAKPGALKEEDTEVEMTEEDGPSSSRGSYRFPSLEPIVDDVPNDADAEMTTEYEETGEEEEAETSEESGSSDGGVEMGGDDLEEGM
ncbi:MAG: hypothetical protein Q9207_001374 [Kuettlingeria erythrocarpa]